MLDEIIERRRGFITDQGRDPKKIHMTPVQLKELLNDCQLTKATGGGFLFFVCGMEIVKSDKGLHLL